jgi:uncharacterized protein YdcH (DUF465 family)
MNNKDRLDHLKKEHKILDDIIADKQKNYVQGEELTRLKKRKLQLKDEIAKLEKHENMPTR